ncbi:hypothetical protein GCM10019817_11590 [Lactobacillus intestinalis]
MLTVYIIKTAKLYQKSIAVLFTFTKSEIVLFLTIIVPNFGVQLLSFFVFARQPIEKTLKK